MPRFIALHTMNTITRERFSAALKEVRQWRPDASTTIIKSYCSLAEGKLVTECQAAKREDFEAWLKQVGWPWDAIYPVDHIAQMGNVWDV